jgi:hypothetical protein
MKKKQHHNIWRLWSYSLGEKHGKNDKEADFISIIRTIIFATYLITNCFIVAGVIRHWNDEPIKIYIQEGDRNADNYDWR